MGFWRVATFLAASLLLATTSTVRAGDVEDFQQARQTYDNRDYAAAAERFQALLGPPPRLRNAALIVESHKYLGAAYVMLGRRDAAEQEFRALLEAEPQYELDSTQFPLEVVELFSSMQRFLGRQQLAEAERELLRAQHEQDQARILGLVAFAEEETRYEVENSRWLAGLPFGVGQFQNGDDGLGWLFLIAETGLLAGSVASLAWHQSLVDDLASSSRRAATTINDGNRLLDQTFITNWICVGLLSLVAIVGIVEAQISFEDSNVTRVRRRVPANLREETVEETSASSTSLRLTPTGIGLSF